MVAIIAQYPALFPTILSFPVSLVEQTLDSYESLLCTLTQVFKLLRDLHVIKTKEFQDASIQVHIA